MAVRSRVVIVGGGFGGLAAARRLRRAPVDVVLIDRCNYHLFQPLLYQVATAALSPADIAYPIRHILRRQRNATVLLGEVVRLDPVARLVYLADGDPVPYDWLILAAGATHTWFGHDDWSHLAPGLKTIEDAVTIRAHFLGAFERAEREPDAARRRELLTFVVVGGGPTGVELAGAMAEIARHVLPGEFRQVDPAEARIVLVEGSPRVLGPFSPESSGAAAEKLVSLGVEVRCGTGVQAIEPGLVRIGDDEVRCRSVFWAAGVAASPLTRGLDAPTDRAGRLQVQPDLSVPGRPEVFVVGDAAGLTDAAGQVVPGVAPAAMQMGRYAADAVVARLAGRPTPPFRYQDKGKMAVVGRGAAVAELAGRKARGLVAWLAWLFIHILYLVGFRNRLAVLWSWGWSYVLMDQGARLITAYERKSPPTMPLSGDPG